MFDKFEEYSEWIVSGAILVGGLTLGAYVVYGCLTGETLF